MFGVKSKIIHFLTEKTRLFDGPIKVTVNPMTYGCNYNCPMCWRNSPGYKYNIDRGLLPFSDYKKLLSRLPLSVKEIEIAGGGEPLLYPDIKKILMIFGRHKKKYKTIITNGSFLDKFNDLFVKLNWNCVRVSLHASNNEIHKAICGVNDFDKVENNLKDLIKKRNNKITKIVLHFVIQKDNYKDIYNFAKFAEKIGVDGIDFAYILPHDVTKNHMLLSEKEWGDVEKQLKIIKDEISLENNINDVFELRAIHPKWNSNCDPKKYFTDRVCSLVMNVVYITGDGVVLPCCISRDLKHYNMNDYSLSSIWKKYQKIRDRFAQSKYYPFCFDRCNYKIE